MLRGHGSLQVFAVTPTFSHGRSPVLDREVAHYSLLNCPHSAALCWMLEPQTVCRSVLTAVLREKR
jgi:hypothetical protein